MYTDKPKNGEFEELAQLLKSWNVSELLPYLQEEAIDTQELQMLKRHHLNDLLRNFRYGTRIRFEHHLERWRRWLNVPLQDATGDDRQCSGGATNTATATSTTSSTVHTGNINNSNSIISSNSNVHCAGCRCSNGSALRHQHQQQQQQQQQLIHSKSELLDESNKQQQHLQQQQQQQHLQQQQQQQQQHLQQQQQQQQLPSEPFVSLNEETEGAFNVPLPLSDHSELVHTELVTADLIKPEMNDIDSSEESGVTVLAILQASPVKAQSLLERLGHNEQLDAVQRLLLIQLICSYYEDNRLHLTLQRSHLLEREILQLFPKEQLCFYRTERRGKIYVRFTNMKRNKRFGSQREQKRRREESMAPPSSFVSKEVTFGGDPMSSPERSD